MSKHPRPAAPRSNPAAPRADDARTNRPRGPDARAPDARVMARAMLAGIRAGAALDEVAAGFAAQPPALQARGRRLALAVLRHRARVDAVLAPLLTRRPRPVVRDVLALAVTEMLAMAAAPHGVVNDAVAALRAGPPGVRAAAGMANAVLRRAAQAQAVWDQAGPAPLPGWLRDPITARWGAAAAGAIEAAHEAGAPLDLTPRPGATDLPEARMLPTGSLRIHAPVQVSALPGYDRGQFWVQDAAAALPARLLAVAPGEAVADLCAAPGGKTLQLAATGAEVTAVEISPARMGRLAGNLARCGLPATLVVADALEWRPDAALDAVLLDAPCSATGTIRRHPELPLLRDGSGIAALADLQARLIDHALSLLRPGGRLVYAVCSLLPAEGEDQLTAALTRHPDLGVILPDAAGLGIPADWVVAPGAIRTRPDFWADHGGIDGFFMVALQRGGTG